MSAILNQNIEYLNVPTDQTLPSLDKERSIAAYEEHNRRVREVIPAERLLDYNVKQGWAPLCEFLEIENCPNIPFPRTNSAVTMKALLATHAIIVVFVFLVLCRIFLYGFEKSMGMKLSRFVFGTKAAAKKRS